MIHQSLMFKKNINTRRLIIIAYLVFFSLSFHHKNLNFVFQASGVTVADVCKTTYEEIKKDKKHRYVIFYIKDERQIDVEVIGPRDAAYDAFLEDLQKGGSGECRYGLFDFEYTHQCQGTSEVITISIFLSNAIFPVMYMLLKVLTELSPITDVFRDTSSYCSFSPGIQETKIILDVVVSRHGQG